MGLAPYGKPSYREQILEHLIHLKDDGSFWMDMRYFNYCQGMTMTSERFHRLFGGQPRKPESPLTQREMDLAASVQVVCEEVMLRCARFLHQQTKMKNLVLAGGVALNCVGNGRILREGPFADVWIQPAAGDAGGALGVAQLIWHHVLSQPRKVEAGDSQHGSLLGPKFEDAETRKFLDVSGAKYHVLENEEELIGRVAELLTGQKIIGWVQGRMEFGPRALGARSILGDPRSEKMQATMNLKIKFRESFRPFAPMVLQEKLQDWFQMREGQESPYMLLVASVLEKHRVAVAEEQRQVMETDPDLRHRLNIVRSTIPAVTHVDYSARVQTVDEKRNPRLHRLLSAFYGRTGCPVLVNTSFNIRGEPIVCTPQDAYRCFLGTHMDVLVLGNILLLKEEQTNVKEVDTERYKASFNLD
jgi:carbamoyltransferase